MKRAKLWQKPILPKSDLGKFCLRDRQKKGKNPFCPQDHIRQFGQNQNRQKAKFKREGKIKFYFLLA